MSLQSELRDAFSGYQISVEDADFNGEEAREVRVEKGNKFLVVTLVNNRGIKASHAVNIVGSYLHRLDS